MQNTVKKSSIQLDLIQKNGNLEEINQVYDLVSIQLKKCAEVEESESDTFCEDKYNSLLDIQDFLVSLASKVIINDINDAKALLDFWVKVAVSERSRNDLLPTDDMVISIHNYLKSKYDLKPSG